MSWQRDLEHQRDQGHTWWIDGGKEDRKLYESEQQEIEATAMISDEQREGYASYLNEFTKNLWNHDERPMSFNEWLVNGDLPF